MLCNSDDAMQPDDAFLLKYHEFYMFCCLPNLSGTMDDAYLSL
jgi:hypothetical protein